MAKRYSGTVTITLTYRDATCDYRCALSSPGGKCVIFVGEPKCLTGAVDSPEAFDDAAHAALSFALHAGSPSGEACDTSEVVEGHAELARGDRLWAVRRAPGGAAPDEMPGYDGQPIRIGSSVELSPSCDLWVRGARFGVVVALKPGPIAIVKLHAYPKRQRVTPELVRAR